MAIHLGSVGLCGHVAVWPWGHVASSWVKLASCGHVAVWPCGHVASRWPQVGSSCISPANSWQDHFVSVGLCGHVAVWPCGHVASSWVKLAYCGHVAMWPQGGLKLGQVGLMLTLNWPHVGSSWPHGGSSWLKLASCWLKLASCWPHGGKLELMEPEKTCKNQWFFNIFQIASCML